MQKRFTIEEHVRWSDTDCTGMIYYGKFLRLCEIAETELFRAVGLPYAEVFDRLAVYLHTADKSHRLTHRPSQGQKGMDERTLMTSQRPSHLW